MINQVNPYMPRGTTGVEATGVNAAEGPVEKAAKAPEAAAPKPELTPKQVERLAELLRGYAMKVTEENVNLLKIMLENGIPLTKENILHMNHAMKLAGSSENAMFMVQNNVKLTKANATQLNGLVSGQMKITQSLNNLMAAIDQLTDTNLAAQLKQILAASGGQKTAQGASQAAEQTATPAGPAQATTQAAFRGEAIAQSANTTADQAAASQNTPPTPGAQQSSAQTIQQATAQAAASPESAQAGTQGVTANQSGGQPNQTTAQTQSTVGQAQQGAQSAQGTQQVAGQSQAGQPAPAGQHANAAAGQTTGQNAQMQTAQALQTAQSAARQSVAQPGAQSLQAAQSAASPPQASQASPVLPQNLLFHLADSNAQDIVRYLNNLRDTMTQIQQTLSGRESADVSRVLQEARSLEAHIDFTSQIKNQTFVQLPMLYNGQESLAALHVYKDAKKSGGSSTGSSSALIALETARMGHFETYVQKNARSVHCQFRLESDKIAQAVRNNIHKLDVLLKQYNYTLDSFTFLPPGEPYTLLDNPKAFEDLTQAPAKAEVHYFDKKA